MRLIFGWLGRIYRSGRAARISSQSQRNSCARSWWTTLRRHRASKRGSGVCTLALDDAVALPQRRNVDVVALDDALNALAEVDPRQSRVVELRFFAGLSLEETSEVMGIATATVQRDWTAGPSLAP